MLNTLHTPRTEVAEWDEVPAPSPDLARVLDEVERAMSVRQVPAERPTPASVRSPRPFAYD